MSTTTTEVTAKDLIAEVRRLAAESPDLRYRDYIGEYDNCVYNATDEAPACIMGQALANLGMPVDPLYEGMRINAILETATDWELNYKVDSWLREVQRGQDGGDTWAQAVQTADAYHGHV